jgi:hypothetical protein
MERLQSSRAWLVGGGLVALVIVAVGWFVFIGPQLASASELQDQAAATGQTNDQLESEISSLEAKSTKLPRYTASLNVALAALPYDSGLPAFTRQLNTQARADNVDIGSVLVGGVSPVEVASSATTPDAGSSAAGTTAGAPATPPASAAPLSAFAVQVTVQSNGPLDRQLAFLQDVQSGPRRVLITSTQVTPGTRAKGNSVDGDASVSTQLSIFSVPQTPDKIRQLKRLLRGDLGD